MVKNIAAISFIYVCVCLAWVILGNVVLGRTDESMKEMGSNVESLWGTAQEQEAPRIKIICDQQAADAQEHKTAPSTLTLSSSNVNVDLKLQQRRKGLVWCPTYRVSFAGDYQVVNPTDKAQTLQCAFTLPSQKAVYDNLHFSFAGKPVSDAMPTQGSIIATTTAAPHATVPIHVAYDSQGLNEWRYSPGQGAVQIRNFNLHMNTDFNAIDFPQGTRSPTSKVRTNNGWQLGWNYDNTVTGNEFGMAMPHLLNPGPWVGQVTFFAPVSLFFFFFATWLITTVKSIRIHPMHYFFIGAAFFSFHLLLAYSVDHIPVEAAFVIASAVSIILVLSYIARAVPDKRLFMQIGVSQFIYLIFFSFTFFIEQFTGLIITCLSIFTLFLSMQYTARFEWSNVFNKKAVAVDPLKVIEQDYLPQNS